MKRAILLLLVAVVLAGCEYRLTSQHELVAMEIGGEIQGSFFLMSGIIDEQEYLFYWRRSGNGYARRKAPTKYSVVYETDEAPTVERWDNFVGYRYFFRVPVGTMVPSFNVMRFNND